MEQLATTSMFPLLINYNTVLPPCGVTFRSFTPPLLSPSRYKIETSVCRRSSVATDEAVLKLKALKIDDGTEANHRVHHYDHDHRQGSVIRAGQAERPFPVQEEGSLRGHIDAARPSRRQGKRVPPLSHNRIVCDTSTSKSMMINSIAVPRFHIRLDFGTQRQMKSYLRKARPI